MPRNKIPPLSDWRVTYLTSGPYIPPVTVRATSLRIRDGAVILEDTYGHPLFAAPAASTVVRRAEPGEAPELFPPVLPVPADAPEPARGGYSGGSPAEQAAPPEPVPSATAKPRGSRRSR